MRLYVQVVILPNCTEIQLPEVSLAEVIVLGGNAVTVKVALSLAVAKLEPLILAF